MLTYKLDLEERSTWIRTTPGDHELAQPFWATEQGDFYAHADFFTERSEKDSYELFYTLDGEGYLEQNGHAVTLRPGSALLIDCRTPQRYRTKRGQERWYHLWVHIDGSGVAAMAETLDVTSLRPVELAEPIARRHFAAIAKHRTSATTGRTVHNSATRPYEHCLRPASRGKKTPTAMQQRYCKRNATATLPASHAQRIKHIASRMQSLVEHLAIKRLVGIKSRTYRVAHSMIHSPCRYLVGSMAATHITHGKKAIILTRRIGRRIDTTATAIGSSHCAIRQRCGNLELH